MYSISQQSISLSSLAIDPISRIFGRRECKLRQTNKLIFDPDKISNVRSSKQIVSKKYKIFDNILPYVKRYKDFFLITSEICKSPLWNLYK